MPDLLDLEGKGWKLQRGYPAAPRWIVAEDERELGNVKSVAITSRPLHSFRVQYLTDQRDAAEYVESFFTRNGGAAARFLLTIPELAPTPDAAPTVEAVAGGTQGSRTIYVRYAWKNALGTTKASPTATIAVPANQLLRVKFPYYPASITQAIIYATQGTQGTEVEQATVTNQSSWTQPDAALLLLTAIPQTANSAKIQAKMRAVGNPKPYEIIRGPGTIYELTIEVEGVS